MILTQNILYALYGEHLLTSYLFAIILGSPKPTMSSMYYNVTSRSGDLAQLTMYNEGYPFPNYTWTYNGTVLPKFMHTDVGSMKQSYSILNISNVSYTDFGNYSVTMTNNIGSYVADYQLLPTGM